MAAVDEPIGVGTVRAEDAALILVGEEIAL